MSGQTFQLHPAPQELLQELSHLLARLHEENVRRSRPWWVHAAPGSGEVDGGASSNSPGSRPAFSARRSTWHLLR